MTGGVRRSNTKANPVVKGSKAKAVYGLTGREADSEASICSESGLALQVRRSESFTQCVQEGSGREDPADFRVQQAYS